MLDWKQFFLAYLRSRSRLFVYLLSLAFLVLLFQFLFASLEIYFLYFFLLCCFVTILFFTWDILVETQVYRQELLYGEREAKSPLEIALAEKLEAREMELYQQRSKAERKLTDLLDYYTLWVHQIKTPIAASQLLVAEVVDRQLKQQLEQEIFKIDSYTNLVLQYLRLESFHDDLVLKQVQIEDLVKEIIRKPQLFTPNLKTIQNPCLSLDPGWFLFSPNGCFLLDKKEFPLYGISVEKNTKRKETHMNSLPNHHFQNKSFYQ
ncbi:hypothetical protein RLF46_11325, partial [Streptococcus pneumoniae]|nr:hypothetical protein [Streptococcus pneumoniae]